MVEIWKRKTLVVLCMGVLAAAPDALRPPAAAAQEELVTGAIGAGLGLAAGGYLAVGAVTLQARRGEFVYAVEDVLGWESAPIALATGAGFVIGVLAPDRLRHMTIGGIAGGFVGTGIGVVYGAEAWDPPEGRWAGGVIGGAAGLLAGGIAGFFWPVVGESSEDDPAGAAAGPVVPIGFTIRF